MPFLKSLDITSFTIGAVVTGTIFSCWSIYGNRPMEFECNSNGVKFKILENKLDLLLEKLTKVLGNKDNKAYINVIETIPDGMCKGLRMETTQSIS